jgi:NitT/TauT family transport system permease protein
MRATEILSKIATQWIPPLLLLLILLAGWEIAGITGYMPKYIAPAPTIILERLFSDYAIIWEHTLWSLQEVAVGYAVGIALGFLIGLAIVYSPVFERALYPIVVASQTIPHLALAPVLVLWFGFGITSKVVIVAQVTFFPIVIATVDGMRSIDPELLLFARSLAASEWQIFRKIRLPASLPYFFTGIRVSAPYAIIAAIIGEWIGANWGLGALMLRAQHMLKTDLMFATVVVMSLVGIMMFLVVGLLQRLLIPWYQAKLERMQQ